VSFCATCFKPIGTRNRTGMCRQHAASLQRKIREPKHCATCGDELGRNNKHGYCRRHLAAAIMQRPNVREKQREGVRRKIAADPVYLESLRKRAAEHARKPETMEQRTRYFRENRVWELGTAAQPAGSEARKRAGRTISAKRLAWCPPYLRKQYLTLIRNHYGQEEARRIVLDQEAADIERMRRKMGEIRPISIKAATHAEVLREIAAAFDVDVSDITGTSRKRHIVEARRTAMYVLRRRGNSMPQIGNILRVDHSSVSHGLDRFEDAATDEMHVVAGRFFEEAEAA